MGRILKNNRWTMALPVFLLCSPIPSLFANPQETPQESTSVPLITEGSIEVELGDVSSLEDLLALVRDRSPQILTAEAKIRTAQTELEAANPSLQSRLRMADTLVRQGEKEFALRTAIAERAQLVTTLQVQAANLWCSLGAATRGEEVAREQEKVLQTLLERAESMRRINEGAAVLVEAVTGEVQGRKYAQMKLQRIQVSVKNQLQFLIGDTKGKTNFQSKETQVPLKLNVSREDTELLLSRLNDNGPGIIELGAIIDVARDTHERAGRAGRDGFMGHVLPWIPGTQGIRGRNDAYRAAQQDVANSIGDQATVAMDEVRARMAALVREAHEAIRQGDSELKSATEQIKRAQEAYRLNDLRLKMNVQGASTAEVLTSLNGLEKAQMNYFASLSDYNFAQARLAAILGDLKRTPTSR